MRLFRRSNPEPAPETRALTWEDFPIGLLAPPTSSVVNISPQVALQSPTTLAAVRAISETVGMLPIAIRRDTGEGWQRDRSHPASRVLNQFANPWTAATDLRTALTLDALLHGHGFARVIRVNGEVRELQRLLPSAVAVEYADIYSDEPTYVVSTANGQIRLSWQDVLHIATPGSARDRKMALIHLAREAIALDIVMAQHQAKTFKSGGLPRVILSPASDDAGGKQGPEIIKKSLKFLREQLSDNSSDPIILPSAFKESITSFGLADMQFLELRRLVIEDIARALRVPATVVGDLSKGTFNNTEQMGRQFLQLCLLPWLEVWEGAITRALIRPEERDTVEAEFIVRDLLRGDFQGQATAYRQATGGSYMTANEARDLEGMPPHPDGDKLIMQAGQTGAGSSPEGTQNASP
ncbi:phage portal protein, HK97 family [Rhizobium sp. RU35A]|uniref:phage portal protein n=1 Tax=Rhizobium sp. RU35A TaxID=1907414 RepID=UPI000954D7AF|nr:phage portal protein [Rhizobium sp. RU35A]SIQ98901.1 phage portal protein, HK97 family [Rhizobium sp. RU35A]